MYNSREIGELRADVAVNCRTLIERAAARGLPVLVVQTVRDVEYQRYLVSMGYAARTATVPTFHAKGVGLAFDICKNVKGHEYDDPGFFTAMGRLGKEMGFTWAATGGAFLTGLIFNGTGAENTPRRWCARGGIRRRCRALKRRKR